MHKPRLVEYNGVLQPLSRVARCVGLPVGTLAARLNRGLSIERATATGLQSRRQVGLVGKSRSPWTQPWSYSNHDRPAETARNLSRL